MLWLIVSVLVLSAAGGAVYVFSKVDSPKAIEILKALGVDGVWAEENSTPFYKWGWERDGDDRVSAEKIVKQAFQNSTVWLDKDDLAFFKEQCSLQQSGSKANDEEIVKRVERIVERTELLIQSIAEQVESAVQPVLSSSESEARDLLRQSGVHSESGNAIQKYCTFKLKLCVDKLGMQVLGLNGRGLSFSDPQSGSVFQIRGVNVWGICVSAVREGVERILVNRKYSSNPNIIRSLKASLNRGTVKELEEDARSAQSCRKILHELIGGNQVELTREHVARCEAILYEWKFMSGVSFKQADHDRIREFLSDNNLFPRFRELFIRLVGVHIDSLSKILDRFPRYVLFYGSQKKARDFARSKYLQHYGALLKAISSPAERSATEPLLVDIPQKDIERIRSTFDEANPSGANSSFAEQRDRSSGISLAKVVGKYQRLTSLEQQMNKDDADAQGWLIDTPLPEWEPEELQNIDKTPLKKFAYFYCDTSSNKDFISDEAASRRKRAQFFLRMIETLIGEKPQDAELSNGTPPSQMAMPKEE